MKQEESRHGMAQISDVKGQQDRREKRKLQKNRTAWLTQLQLACKIDVGETFVGEDNRLRVDPYRNCNRGNQQNDRLSAQLTPVERCLSGCLIGEDNPHSLTAHETFVQSAPEAAWQILQRGALLGLNKRLGLPSRNPMNVLQAGDLICWQRNAHRLVGLGRLRGILLLFPRDVR